MSDLNEAIAEVKRMRLPRKPFNATSLANTKHPSDLSHIATILNAVMSDALTPPVAARETPIRCHQAGLTTADDTQAPHWLTNCTQCGRVVDTREADEGGDDHGCNMGDGQWVCSSECWDAAIDAPQADPVREAGKTLYEPYPGAFDNILGPDPLAQKEGE